MIGTLHKYRIEIGRSILAAAAFVLVGALFVVPVLLDIRGLDERIAATEQALVMQEIFLPAFEEFRESGHPGAEGGFPVPASAPASIADISALPALLESCAQSAGMGVLDVIISPSSLRSGSGTLRMQAVLAGSTQQFDECYRCLAAEGAVDRVSRVEMQAVPGGVECFVELWLGITGEAG